MTPIENKYARNLATLQAFGLVTDPNANFEVEVRTFKTNVIYDYNKAIPTAPIRIFAQQEDAYLLQNQAYKFTFDDVTLRDRSTAIIGFHINTNLAFTPADASLIPDCMYRFLYESYIEVQDNKQTPLTKLSLAELAQTKFYSTNTAAATASSVSQVDNIIYWAPLRLPIVFPANSEFKMMINHTPGLTTAVTGVALPVLTNLVTASSGQALTTPGRGYRMTIEAQALVYYPVNA